MFIDYCMQLALLALAAAFCLLAALTYRKRQG